MRYYLPPLVVAALLAWFVWYLMPEGRESVRSVYDVNWGDVSWCVYTRLGPGYTPPEKLQPILRFCTVVGEGELLP